MLYYGVVRDIWSDRTVGSGKRIEELAPLDWHAIWVVKVGLIKTFNIGGVSTRKVGGA
jgi:hypothetical protein